MSTGKNTGPEESSKSSRLVGGERTGKVLLGDLPKDHPDATTQITVKFSNADLELIGVAADARRISRAALMRMAIFEFIAKKP